MATESLFTAWLWRTQPRTRGGPWCLAGLKDGDLVELKESCACRDVEELIDLSKQARHRGGSLAKHLANLRYVPDEAERPPRGEPARVLRRPFHQHLLTAVKKSRSGTPGGRGTRSGRRPRQAMKAMKAMRRRRRTWKGESGSKRRKNLVRQGHLELGTKEELRMHWGKRPHQKMSDSWERRSPVVRSQATKAMKARG